MGVHFWIPFCSISAPFLGPFWGPAGRRNTRKTKRFHAFWHPEKAHFWNPFWSSFGLPFGAAFWGLGLQNLGGLEEGLEENWPAGLLLMAGWAVGIQGSSKKVKEVFHFNYISQLNYGGCSPK